MQSDKFTWQQKQDMIKDAMENNKFALESNKFGYQQGQDAKKFDLDLKKYELDMKKAEKEDNPQSHREWELAGKPGTFMEFLDRNKVGKSATAAELQAGSYAKDIKAANNTINDTSKGLFGAFRVMDWAHFKDQESKPTFLQDPEYQKFRQASQMLINAINRKQSGAAVSDTEWKNAFDRYLPQGGDSKEVRDQKQAVRDTQLKNFMTEAGPGLGDDFKSNAFKKSYADLGEYAKDNKDKSYSIDGQQRSLRDAVDYVGKKHPNWSDDDILQAFQSLDSGEEGKTEPLSMGGKGSTSMEQPEVGSLSAKYESGGGNPGAIGYDQTGGLSYGSYQLAHSNAKKFVDQSPYASEFKGVPFNSEAFKQKWKEVAKNDPEGFKRAQHEYVADTHFEPQKEKLATLGVNLEGYSPVLKDVIFSTGVQHGPNNNIITSAFKKLGKDASEEDIIREVYKERWAGGKRFASSTPAVRQSVWKRFFGRGGELNTAINQLKQYA